MLKEVRCSCGRLLAKVGGGTEIQIKCPRCGVLNHLKAMSLAIAPLSATAEGQTHGTTYHPLDRRQAAAR